VPGADAAAPAATSLAPEATFPAADAAAPASEATLVAVKATSPAAEPTSLASEATSVPDTAERARAASAAAMSRKWPRFAVPLWTGVAASMLISSVGALAYYYVKRPIEYRTSVDPQEFTLRSGYKAYLFPNTYFEEKGVFSDGCASRLMGGSVSMIVPADARQPFCLRSGNSRIEALGSRFNVLYLKGQTSVYLEDGNATLSLNDESVVLGPEQFTQASDDGGIGPVSVVHVAESTRPYRVLHKFNNATLPDIVDHFNTINSSLHMRVRGTAALRRFTGALDLTNPEVLLKLLGNDATLNITRQDQLVTITAR
jgi:ferric-dicitrate binding protein FerR (iron transport regulator)